MSKLTIDYIFSRGFQISFRFFEAKFLPRIYVEGKFSKEIGKKRDRMCLPKQNSSFLHLVVQLQFYSFRFAANILSPNIWYISETPHNLN